MEESMVPTLGNRLDAMVSMVSQIELSSAQLFGVIVLATVGLCFVLLGTGAQQHDNLKWPDDSNHSKSQEGGSTRSGKQPRWHIFKWINRIAMVSFVGSVAWFGLHASHYMEEQGSSLPKFLMAWSVFLCYFFGFFGVSLVHEFDMGHYHLVASGDTSASVPNSKKKQDLSPSAYHSSQMKDHRTGDNAVQKPIHQHTDSTNLCSDPPVEIQTKSTTAPQQKLSCSTSNDELPVSDLPDEKIASLVLDGKMKDHELEKTLDPFRAVDVRRIIANKKLESITGSSNVLKELPSQPSLDYSKVYGANCEIVVGYIPLPVGLVGPLTLNNESVYVPMATTEGCLVASTNRGAKAISQGGGASAAIVRDGITRAPCLQMATAMQAVDVATWCEDDDNFSELKSAFESTTSFGKLKSCRPTVAGRNVYLRLVCFSGDAMGMNMVSKGTLAVVSLLQSKFPSLKLIALSGNMCTDKKAAATNWLEGRGKSVVVEAIIPKNVVKTTLKTSVEALVHVNLNKNLIGSAMAGALGGFNAHASNIVTAIFLATGQDPAQNVESSNCITLMEKTEEGNLWISCTMPSIEVGTVGGGTSLAGQAACLEAMGCRGGGITPGQNAKKLATIVAGATMAGELSLLSALAANTLVQAHMKHNRKKTSD